MFVDGAFLFDGTNGLEIINFPTFNESLFSIGLVYGQQPFTGGYLLAKTASSGYMYWGLFQSADSPTLFFYYRPINSPSLQFVSFPVALNNGQVHALVLSINTTTAHLSVITSDQEVTFNAALVAPVQDCVGACVLTLGQRANSSAASATGFMGAITDAFLQLGVQLSSSPIVANASYFPPPIEFVDSLTNLFTFASTSQVTTFGTGFQFAGSGGMLVYPTPRLSALFSLAITFSQALLTRGYIFSLSDEAGQSRSLAVYSSGITNTITLFYASQGLFSQVTAPYRVADGLSHTLLIAAASNLVTLTIDGVQVISQPLVSQINACSGLCYFYLGQRSNEFGGDFFLTGTVTAAWATPLVASSLLDFGRSSSLVSSRMALQGAAVASLPAPPSFSSSITIAFELTQAINTAGLVLAKLDAGGALLFGVHLATFSTDMSSTLTLLYTTPSGGLFNTSVTMPRLPTDTSLISMTSPLSVSLSGQRAILHTSQGMIPFALSQSLAESNSCSSCVLTVGGPASGFSGFQGVLTKAQVYYDVSL